MTFNRYIRFRAVLECIGAISCMLMACIGNDLVGVIVAAASALLWIGGEVWGLTVYQRHHPRRDELSDMHQHKAMQFALISLVGFLVVIGFIYTVLNLVRPLVVHVIPPDAASRTGHVCLGRFRYPLPVVGTRRRRRRRR